jgi:hypothetical protein
MKFAPSCILLVFMVMSQSAQGQNKPDTPLGIRRASGPIVLDGVLDEDAWKNTPAAGDFWLNYPSDTIPPSFRTEARVTFDDKNLYVSFYCFDDEKPFVVQSLKRDFEFNLNDNVSFVIDPYNDHTNGFFFSLSPYNVQLEGTISSGGNFEFSYADSWDNKWYSATKRNGDHWVAEMAIPFKSFRFNGDAPHWNVTFIRFDLKHNEVSSWIATPIQFIPAAFAYSGELKWEDPSPRPGPNVSLIPYASTRMDKDFEEGSDAAYGAAAGFDAKVAVTSSLNLDLTFNPDFSQVDVDRQVINLTRFEVNFPERRQFFLENSDLFASLAFPDSRPFFSRRIGIADDSTGLLQQVPIAWGGRLSGQIGKKWRVGVMDLQTKDKPELGLPDQNYGVAVLQRQLFGRSNLSFVFTNKQSLGLSEYDSSRYYHEDLIHDEITPTDTVKRLNLYNRVAGAEFKLFTESTRWSGKAYYYQSFDEFSTDDKSLTGFWLNYQARNINANIAESRIGENYTSEMGFLPGKAVYPGYYSTWINVMANFYPKKSGHLIRSGPTLEAAFNHLLDGQMTDRDIALGYQFAFSNTSMLTVNVRDTYQLLPSDFDPLYPLGDSSLLAGEEYHWNLGEFQYTTDTRKTFTMTLRGRFGGYYNGTVYGLGGDLGYRFQPYARLSATFDYNQIDLPDAYGSASFVLISPRLDLTFTNSLFLTTFVQYNSRFDNINLNARLQWRFRPASDVFLVYTENYFPDFVPKNRALVLKATYWLNL